MIDTRTQELSSEDLTSVKGGAMQCGPWTYDGANLGWYSFCEPVADVRELPGIGVEGGGNLSDLNAP